MQALLAKQIRYLVNNRHPVALAKEILIGRQMGRPSGGSSTMDRLILSTAFDSNTKEGGGRMAPEIYDCQFVLTSRPTGRSCGD